MAKVENKSLSHILEELESTCEVEEVDEYTIMESEWNSLEKYSKFQAEDTQAGVSIVRSPIQIDDSSNSSNDLLDISDYTPAAKKEKTDISKQTKVNNSESAKPKKNVPEKRNISSSTRQRNNPTQSRRRNSATKQTKPLSKAKSNEADSEAESSISAVEAVVPSSVPLEYSRGSVVWAKIAGYSHWPGLIDDDPDEKSYFWVEKVSPLMVQYHVVFFDSKTRLSRSWCTPSQLKPFTHQIKHLSLKSTSLVKRLDESLKDAVEASSLNAEDRLKKYGFMARLRSPGTKLCEY